MQEDPPGLGRTQGMLQKITLKVAFSNRALRDYFILLFYYHFICSTRSVYFLAKVMKRNETSKFTFSVESRKLAIEPLITRASCSLELLSIPVQVIFTSFTLNASNAR